MENRPFDQQDQDDSKPEVSPRKKRGISALSRYLSGIRRKETEENEENESSDEKPKRFKRLFSRLFPSVVENPTLTDSKSTKNQSFIPEGLFSFLEKRAYSDADDPSTAEEVTEEPVYTDVIGPVAEKPADTTSSDNTVEVAVGDEVASSPETLVPEMASDAIEPPTNEPTDELSSTLYTRETLVTPTTEISKTEQPTPKHEDTEVVVERGPGVLLPVALTGLEHLGRKKADKKLEQRVIEKIDNTNQEVKRNAVLQQEIDSITRQNKEQLEALKRAREREQANIDAMVDEQPQRSPNSQILNREIQKPIPEDIPRQYPNTPEYRQTQKETSPETIKPQKILEQVADAAEQNVAVERVFERSHEVKDDQPLSAGATSVGTVMANQASNLPQHIAQSVYGDINTKQSANNATQVTGETVRGAYMQAMKAGFWAGVLIIILGSIAYLVIQ